LFILEFQSEISAYFKENLVVLKLQISILSIVKRKLHFCFNICVAYFPTTEGKKCYLASILIENAAQGTDFKIQLFFWRKELI